MSEKKKMHTGELYLPGDEAIMKEQAVYQDMLFEYNQTKPSETEKRAEMLKKCLVTVVRVYISRHLFMLILVVIIAILEIWFMQITI